MVDTLHLQPPGSGLSSDPLLFGVGEALARLFPLEESHVHRDAAAPTERYELSDVRVVAEDLAT